MASRALAPREDRRIRHRRQLAAAGDTFGGAARRVAELAAEAGLSRSPAVVVGRQADTFTFGVPGRYVIALPRGLAVRWRHPQLFDPVLSDASTRGEPSTCGRR